MAADSQGNDVTAVGLPVTGFIGLAPLATTLPTPVEGKSTSFALPAAFKKLGLFKEDGGFEWTLEADGDPITFWQDGYSIPSGLANATLDVTLAQYDETVRRYTYGKTPDANGYMTIDAAGNAEKYVLFTEEIFKNGVIRRRVAASVGVTAAKQDQSTRGEVLGTALTFKADRSAQLGNNHIGEWLIPAPTSA